MLVGELFRLYRRRLFGTAAVCRPCAPKAASRGWTALRGELYRQQTGRARALLTREPRNAGARAFVTTYDDGASVTRL